MGFQNNQMQTSREVCQCVMPRKHGHGYGYNMATQAIFEKL